MALTLLRHAAVAPEYQGCYNGWSDIGIDTAQWDKEAAQRLQQQTFDAIYSSDLLRCTQTLDRLGFTHYISDTRLREVRFKSFAEGKDYAHICKRADFDKSLLEDAALWHDYLCDENMEDFHRRIDALIQELPKDKEILFCTHGGVIYYLMQRHALPWHKIDYLQSIRIENELY
jgi:alpha-ribazole phosphatase/probable phosphoglycerate mutase